jgi:3-oxoacyl-[acyl-carrier protein] reductase
VELGLKGRVAVITGGGQGIGYASALALAKEGVRLSICARTKASIEAAAERIAREAGTEAMGVTADVSIPADVERLARETLARFGRVDILVNNAGGRHLGPVLTLSDEDWAAQLNLKLMGAVRCCRAIVPHLPKTGAGRVINIGGIMSKQVFPTGVITSATNAAVTSLTKYLAQECGKDKILVTAVAPGLVRTEAWEKITANLAQTQNISQEQVYQNLLEANGVPLGRWAHPREIADLVVFLASDRASYITGTTILADGGLLRAVH